MKDLYDCLIIYMSRFGYLSFVLSSKFEGMVFTQIFVSVMSDSIVVFRGESRVFAPNKYNTC